MSTPGGYPPPQQPAPQPGNEPNKTLGIVGIVCSVLCWPAGLIIAIIGLGKVKETGEPNTLFKVALIISIIVGALGIISSIVQFAALGAASS